MEPFTFLNNNGQGRLSPIALNRVTEKLNLEAVDVHDKDNEQDTKSGKEPLLVNEKVDAYFVTGKSQEELVSPSPCPQDSNESQQRAQGSKSFKVHSMYVKEEIIDPSYKTCEFDGSLRIKSEQMVLQENSISMDLSEPPISGNKMCENLFLNCEVVLTKIEVNEKEVKIEENTNEQLGFTEPDSKPSFDIESSNAMEAPKEQNVHKCDVCQKLFTHSSLLEGHKAVHSGQMSCITEETGVLFKESTEGARKITGEGFVYKCDICQKPFTDALLLKRHLAIYWKKNIWASCVPLKKSIEKAKRKAMNRDAYECDVCQQRFVSLTNFRRHRKDMRSQPYKCDVCQQVFFSSCGFIGHLRDSHKKDQRILPEEYKYYIKELLLSGNNLDKLTSLRKRVYTAFHQRGKKSIHLMKKQADDAKKRYEENQRVLLILNQLTSLPDKVHTAFHQEENTSTLNRVNKIDRIKQVPIPKTLKCTFCARVFLIRKQFVNHIKQHRKKIKNGLREWKCTICGKRLSSQQSLKLHTSSYHGGEKSFKCDVCRRFFVDLRHLRIHMRVVHTEKKYLCSFCGKPFISKHKCQRHEKARHSGWFVKCEMCQATFPALRALKRHLIVHIGEKNCKCDECGKEFMHQESLTNHKKRIHSGEIRLPSGKFKCAQCGKVFVGKINLENHERTHTGEKPFKCDVYDQRFNQESSLRRHKRIHSGEKPYKCDHCSQTFSQSCSLKRHQVTHTGQKPYMCDVCGKAFTQSCYLSFHKKKKHA